jgi:hypothetical protein
VGHASSKLFFWVFISIVSVARAALRFGLPYCKFIDNMVVGLNATFKGYEHVRFATPGETIFRFQHPRTVCGV